MPLVPWWALLSSACAPIVLIGGWLIAAALQPSGYDPVTETISALAAYGAADRWLMTMALLALGACHTVTALGLRGAAPAGRVMLAVGAVASVLVALSPEPPGASSPQHIVATGVGFTALAVWPCLAAVRDRPMPWALRPAPSFSVTVMLLAGAAWFLLELHGHGAAGFAERVLTAAQATWPLVVAASLRLTFGPASRSASPSGAPTTDTRSA